MLNVCFYCSEKNLWPTVGVNKSEMFVVGLQAEGLTCDLLFGVRVAGGVWTHLIQGGNIHTHCFLPTELQRVRKRFNEL